MVEKESSGGAEIMSHTPPLGLASLGAGTGGDKMALTFTFMRSSQKFRGGSTMVVLSSMT